MLIGANKDAEGRHRFDSAAPSVELRAAAIRPRSMVARSLFFFFLETSSTLSFAPVDTSLITLMNEEFVDLQAECSLYDREKLLNPSIGVLLIF